MKKYALLLLGAACLIVSCNQSQHENRQPSPAQDPVATLQATDSAGLPVTNLPGEAPPADWDKKLIKTAKVRYRVADCDRFQQRVYATVSRYGGYIASENGTEQYDRKEAGITIKVPVQYFDRLLAELPDSTVKTESRTVSTEDVSAEVVDVQARVEAKKQMRQRYHEFFRQAKNMEEMLQVQTALNELQGNIESAAGRLQWLRKQSAYSTIELTCYQLLQPVALEEEGSPSFLNRTAQAFADGAGWLGNLLVGVVSLWPLWVLILLGIWAWRKTFRIRTGKQNA